MFLLIQLPVLHSYEILQNLVLLSIALAATSLGLLGLRKLNVEGKSELVKLFPQHVILLFKMIHFVLADIWQREICFSSVLKGIRVDL